MKLRSYLIEDGNFLDHDPLFKNEAIRVRFLLCMNFLENKQLILLLLIHDQIFATDDT